MDVNDPKTEKPQLTPLSLTSTDSDDRFDIAQETLIGREVECTISLDSPHVSRYHAKIIIGNEGAQIEDLNSSNGTFVNGKRIKEKTKISLGDELRFDTLSFRLTSKDAGKSDAGKSDATVVLNRDAMLGTVAQAETLQPGSPTLDVNDKAPEKNSELNSETVEESDEDSTRMLSSEQINNIAEINKKLQKFTDSGSGPRFVAMSAPIRGKVFELDTKQAGNSWRFGRSRECELCVSAPSISRQHGTVRKEDSRFYFTAEPGKKLLVNGEDKTEALLKHNDEIQIGPIEFIFRLDEQQKPDGNIIIEEVPDNSLRNILLIGAAGVILLSVVTAYLLLTK